MHAQDFLMPGYRNLKLRRRRVSAASDAACVLVLFVLVCCLGQASAGHVESKASCFDHRALYIGPPKGARIDIRPGAPRGRAGRPELKFFAWTSTGLPADIPRYVACKYVY